MFGKIQKNDFLLFHNQLRDLYFLKLRYELNEEARKHIGRGLMMRIEIMEEALLTLDRELGSSDAPLNKYISIKLTLLLNTYYINLVGSLDNLAWALSHQKNLLENIDEANSKHRRRTQLVDKNFLKLLQDKGLGNLSSWLKTVSNWYWDVRNFRDPAAHRIPLYVPPSICSEKDIERANTLDAQAAEMISNDNWQQGLDMLDESRNVGEHQPVFVTDDSGIKVYDLKGQVNQDHKMLLKVIDNVFQNGFGVDADWN